ncbi:APC family permease [Rhodopila sp.]|uniref:APC family permease n=1 Tax=Rhodopila sp. TaxID=2480087 RepID=UPI003D0FC2FD
MPLSLSRLLIGRPVSNKEAQGHKLGIFSGLPAMGLDGLGSASYGPEAALTILAGTGTAGLAYIGPITWVILALLAILWFSYWQTIKAYPNNGGSYIVAKDNLGINAGLLAAAALMVDYMLNVAVGISAGIGALTSAIPELHAYTLYLCPTVLAVLTVLNLRGTREAGLAWSLPTYIFILTLGFIIAWGVFKAITTGGHPHPVVSPPETHQAVTAVSLWLLLRAFASGCSAMTGVEAVSNGISAFRDPPVKHARATLSAIVLILGLLLLGIAHLAAAYGISAMDQSKDGYQSVLSQLVKAVYGRGWFYDLTITSVLAVLCLSANTSFVDFPRMCRLVARDGFLPRGFAVPGRRLVCSVGILFLTLGSGGLLVAFDGITDRLIPLFAIGAFLSFTMSQSGMAAHWWRAQRKTSGTDARPLSATRGRAKLAINGGGAVATGIALGIILIAKFTDGAWLTIIIIPCTVLLLKIVRHYYDQDDRQLRWETQRSIDLRDHGKPVALVPIKRWDRLSRNAVEYALRLTPDLIALHATTLDGPEAEREETSLKQEWRKFVEEPACEAGLPAPRLLLMPSHFRSVTAPFLKGIEHIQKRLPGRPVMIVLPELVEGRWWGYMMHTHRERRLRAQLLRYGGKRIAVVSVPWQLKPQTPRQGLAQEEPSEPVDKACRHGIRLNTQP